MFKATKDRPLATTLTGSLPRPSWFTENLNGRPFSLAMTDLRFREQYCDTLAAHFCDQSIAGIEIFVDGDSRFDADVGGRAWFAYMFERMGGMEKPALQVPGWSSPREQQRGDILQRVQECRLPASITGEITPGDLEYTELWKIAQSMSAQPVKLGSCCAQLLDAVVVNRYYKQPQEVTNAIADSMNKEYRRLADAGAPVIQLEEPLIQYVASMDDGARRAAEYVEVFNREVDGLRDKTEIWAHTCWGNPLAQRVEVVQDYTPGLSYLNALDVDVITFETASDEGENLEAIAKAIGKDKKVAIGAIHHRSLEIERPEQVANLVRRAATLIGPERLIISSDCGFGRQGMSRMHAFFKMVSLRLGVNIVRKELGLEEIPSLAADPRFALI